MSPLCGFPHSLSEWLATPRGGLWLSISSILGGCEMGETAYLLLALGLGVAMTAVFLGLGIWIGYQVGKSAAPPPENQALALQLERLHRDLAYCEKLGDCAAMQVQKLSASSIQSALMPRDMAA